MLRDALRVIAVGIACLAATGVDQQARSGTLAAWKSHSWSLGAYTNDRTKEFSHCAASAKYQSGTLLLFGITGDLKWNIGFSNPQWNLRPGSVYSIKYVVDENPVLTMSAEAINKEMIIAQLLDSAKLFELFRRGRLLRVQAEGPVLQFNLDNTSQILKELLECARRYARGDTVASTNPFEAAKNPTQPTVALLRAEATAIVANVLSTAGVGNFTLAPEIPERLSFLHAIWSAPGLLGGVQIIETESPSSAAATRLAFDADKCAGTFASGKLPATGGAVRLMTACSENNKPPTRAEYTIVARPKGGVYIMLLIGTDATSEVENYGTRLMDAAVKSIR